MMRINRIVLITTFLLLGVKGMTQEMSLDSIFTAIRLNNPGLKMFDADIRSMDEAAKGARSWMPPEVGAGFYMTPYDISMWKGDGMGNPGMGQFMISAQQMFPNKSRLDAESKYMQAMSSVEKEKKNYSLNELYAEAKKNYYDWMLDKRKLVILEQDEKLLNFMIESAELRYKNGMEKISAYYKAKAALGNVESMSIMLESEIRQKRIALNALMNRDKEQLFDIDTLYTIKDFSTLTLDSTTFINARSDIKAIEKTIQLNNLQINLERTKLKPEFGVKYDNMIAFGALPLQYSLMGMVKIPMAPWSSKMYKANIESYKWKSESLNQQKALVINEAQGMTASMLTDFEAKKKQIRLYENNIIPALKKNYQTMQLGYQQNTEELFMLFDAWETLNMTQLDYIEQTRQLLVMQSEIEKLLEIK
jgi:outer membrane protein TolC